jgi:hypothetical protein
MTCFLMRDGLAFMVFFPHAGADQAVGPFWPPAGGKLSWADLARVSEIERDGVSWYTGWIGNGGLVGWRFPSRSESGRGVGWDVGSGTNGWTPNGARLCCFRARGWVGKKSGCRCLQDAQRMVASGDEGTRPTTCGCRESDTTMGMLEYDGDARAASMGKSPKSHRLPSTPVVTGLAWGLIIFREYDCRKPIGSRCLCYFHPKRST